MSYRCIASLMRRMPVEIQYEQGFEDPMPTPVVLPPIEDVPLIRMRDFTSGEKTGTTGIHFWDIIPMEVYAPIGCKLENDDLLVHFLDDEDDDGEKFMLIIKITESLGNFGNSLIYRKYQATPNLGDIPSQVMTYLETLRQGYHNDAN
jgi:hypothetical protein